MRLPSLHAQRQPNTALTSMKTLTITQLFTLTHLRGSWQQVQEKFRYAPFRDVIDYRDYHYFIDQKAKQLRHEVLAIRYRSTYSVRARSQRSKGMNRVLTYFNPADLIVYNLLCQHVHRCSQRHYFRNTYFSRAISSKTDDIVTPEGEFFFEPYGGTFREWRRFSNHRAKVGRKRALPMVLVTDITNFFETIHHEIIRDTVAPNVKNAEITNLLLLFLGDQILRPRYSAHLRLGIPQDSFDCSRVLANLVLLKLDKLVDTATKGEWVRWMDDFSIAVRSEAEAHKLNRDITEKLREDGLSLNTGKTRAFDRTALKTELLIVENALLDKLRANVRAGMLRSSVKSLKSLWRKLWKDDSALYHEKVLARILGLAGELNDPFLLPYCYESLKKYPKLHKAIFSYIESIPHTPRILDFIIKYLESGFDLYEEVRVQLLEALTCLDLTTKERTKVLGLAWKCFLNKKHLDQDYSRAAALLVIAAYGSRPAYKKLLKFFESSDPRNFSQVVRRYLVAILLSADSSFHNAVLNRAMNETGDLVKDLFLFSMHSKTRTAWDKKTIASFRLNHRGFSKTKFLPIRKILLLGILTHHPEPLMRARLLDEVKDELDGIGVTVPRRNMRTDELAFNLLATRY